MDPVHESLTALHREAMWLEDVTRAAVDGRMPFTPHRVENISAACGAVQQAHERFRQALRAEDDDPEEDA